MKKLLLSTAVFVSIQAFGQLTQANEPAIGASATMYTLDSNATNMASVTGTGVTWDYSTTWGYPGQTENLACVDPASTSYASNYTSATKALDITGFVTNYFTSSSSSRNNKGFVFDGGQVAGTVQVVFDTDDELAMNYPFAVTDNLTDVMSGTAYTGSLGNLACSGTASATVDGTGTLKLNAATTLTGVLRYKLVDQVTATVPFVGTVTMDRVQFEYYHFGTSNLPVFVHSSLTITMAGSPTVQNIVLSSVVPDKFLAVNEVATVQFGMYPNPTKENVTLQGLSGNETIQITDVAGRVIVETTATGVNQTIDVSMLNAGVYHVLVSNNGATGIKNLVIE